MTRMFVPNCAVCEPFTQVKSSEKFHGRIGAALRARVEQRRRNIAESDGCSAVIALRRERGTRQPHAGVIYDVIGNRPGVAGAESFRMHPEVGRRCAGEVRRPTKKIFLIIATEEDIVFLVDGVIEARDACVQTGRDRRVESESGAVQSVADGEIIRQRRCLQNIQSGRC